MAPQGGSRICSRMPIVADTTVAVPLWLLWSRTFCCVLSVAGLALHYNLRVCDRRKVKRAIVTFFVAVARANRLKRLSRAAAVVERGMRAIYGYRTWRIVIISFFLSGFYIIAAFLASGGFFLNWKSARTLKAQLEMKAEPVLYRMSAGERLRALRMDCYGFGESRTCYYPYNDPSAIATRKRASIFEDAYRQLVAREPKHAQLTILTMWDGTYLHADYRDSDLYFFQGVSLFCLNILLDLSGVLLLLSVAGRLSRSLSLGRMIRLVLIALVGSTALAFLSLYAYWLVESGDAWGAAAVLGFPIGALMILSALLLMASGRARTLIMPHEPLPNIFLTAPGVILMGSFLVGSSLPHLLRPHLVTINLGDPGTVFYYLLAAGTVLPTFIGTSLVLTVVLLGVFARALLFPTLIYLRTVLRTPAPLLVTLASAPAVLLQTLVSNWPDIHKMLHLH
jgi:hypothetical protein